MKNFKTSFWKALEAAAESKGFKGLCARWFRVLALSAASFTVNEVPVRAAALTFTTLLTIIPFAVILSLLAGRFGYLHLLSRLIPYLAESLNIHLPLDPILTSINRAQHIGFHRLGWWGMSGLLLTFFISMSNVESAVNRVWNLYRTRSLLQRLKVYTPFLLILLGLVAAGALMLLRARHGLESWGFSGKIPALKFRGESLLFGAAGMLIFTWVGLFLMIRILPNTYVKAGPAFFGATAATALIYFFSRLLFVFPAVLMSQNKFLYGSLAIFPVMLLLSYVFWAAALFGATASFVYQRLYGGGARENRNLPTPSEAHSNPTNAWQEAAREAYQMYAHEKT